MKTHHIIWSLSLLVLLSSCTVVRQGEVGVKRNLGKLNFKTIEPGPVAYNPFTTRVIKLPVRTVNIEITSQLPSKEGLNVASVISILYRVIPEKAPEVIANIGPEYEDAVIIGVFRSAAADVCSQFFAKDMHSSQRSHIEQAISNRMESLLKPRGFEVEAVLLKTIQLPEGLAQAVEEKLEAEQDAQRMEFLLQRERLEAQRKIVEAEGIRDAQQVISEGLNPEIIQWQSIEAFRELAQSPNAKVIITNGETPMLIEPQGAQESQETVLANE
ncbi:MAG: prohibitin family protein [Bacteroidota bacterium]